LRALNVKQIGTNSAESLLPKRAFADINSERTIPMAIKASFSPTAGMLSVFDDNLNDTMRPNL
jgi:hypothetical protein